jgi:hypothetical protein
MVETGADHRVVKDDDGADRNLAGLSGLTGFGKRRRHEHVMWHTRF